MEGIRETGWECMMPEDSHGHGRILMKLSSIDNADLMVARYDGVMRLAEGIPECLWGHGAHVCRAGSELANPAVETRKAALCMGIGIACET